MSTLKYWHHAESCSVGIFSEQHLKDWNNGVGEPVEQISETQYRRLAEEYGIDVRKDHNDFYDNLEYAQHGEDEVARLLVKRFKDFEFVGFNEDSECDIIGKVGDELVHIEVKEDVRTKDTGNVVIERESRGKPSGIMTTKSKFWVLRIHLKDGIVNLLFKTKNLKQAIRDRRYHDKRQMPHTDSNNVLYFFRYDVIKEYATKIL